MTSKRFFMFMLVLLAGATALSVGGYIWANRQLRTKSLVISDLLAERDAQTEKIQRLNEARATVKDANALNELIYALLPKQKQQENLVADIIYTATQEVKLSSGQVANITFNTSGVPDNLSGTSASKDVPGVYVYPFNIDLRNVSYATMLAFFTELEKNKRIIQADQVQISPDKSKAGMLTSVTLSLKTYVQQ